MPENTRGTGREVTGRSSTSPAHWRGTGARLGYRALAMPYEVHTPVYEGPFDLLLHLILREEVELWEVSLAAIVDAYLAELDAAVNGIEPTLDLDVATEFLLIAATLVELKARRLLPGLEEVELDEELLRFEERDLLLARLLECKTFKDAAAAFEARIRRAERSVPRRAGPEEPYRFLEPDPLERLRPTALRAAALRAFTALRPVVVDTEHVAPIRASVRDAVDTVLRLLPGTEAMSFRALVAGVPSRLELVVRFLAVLELYKQGVVDLLQFTNFGELMVRRLRPGEIALDTASLDDWDDTPTTDDERART
jgi:segregation and condensation protein A